MGRAEMENNLLLLNRSFHSNHIKGMVELDLTNTHF